LMIEDRINKLKKLLVSQQNEQSFFMV